MAGARHKTTGGASAADGKKRPPRALLARIMWNAGINGPSDSEFGELTLEASTDIDKMAEARERLIAILKTPYGLEVMQELLWYGEPTKAHRTAGRRRRTLADIKPRESFFQPRAQEFGELTLKAFAPAEKVQEARERLTAIIASSYGHRALQSISRDNALRLRLLRAFSGPKLERGRLAEKHVRITVGTADPADFTPPNTPPGVEMSEYDALAAVARNEDLGLRPLISSVPTRGRRPVPTHPVAAELAIAIVEGRRPPGTTGTAPPDDPTRIAEWVRHVLANDFPSGIAPQTLARQVAAEVEAIEVLNPRGLARAKRRPTK